MDNLQEIEREKLGNQSTTKELMHIFLYCVYFIAISMVKAKYIYHVKNLTQNLVVYTDIYHVK